MLLSGEFTFPDIEVHALQSLVIDLINLLVDVLGLLHGYLAAIIIATVDTLQARRIVVLLGKVNTISSHR